MITFFVICVTMLISVAFVYLLVRLANTKHTLWLLRLEFSPENIQHMIQERAGKAITPRESVENVGDALYFHCIVEVGNRSLGLMGDKTTPSHFKNVTLVDLTNVEIPTGFVQGWCSLQGTQDLATKVIMYRLVEASLSVRIRHEANESLIDQLNLEGVGSGSGLMELTRESDDGSLAAELLNNPDAGALAHDLGLSEGVAVFPTDPNEKP